MGVPAHDQRDFEFAQKYKINIKKVITKDINDLNDNYKNAFEENGFLISRQRYWGCPIPIINCPKCGPIPEKQNNLPVKLPKQVKIDSNKINLLNQSNEWHDVQCPRCGRQSKRESDTMDTFMCSSWYFLRYPCAELDLSLIHI